MEMYEFAGYQIICVMHRFQFTLENETQRADGRMEYINLH